jgi:hypothetical protein
VDVSSWNVHGVSRVQCPALAAARDLDRPGEDLDTLVLTGVDMARHAPARIQTDMDAQERALSVGAGIQERQVLSSACVVEMLASGSGGQTHSAAATKRPSVVVMLRIASRRAFVRIPGMRWSNRTHGGIEITSNDSETRVPAAIGSKR